MAKAEKLLIENKLLKDFLKDDFTNKLDKFGKIFPISIVFINEIERDGKKISNPIIISHQNNEEVKNKIIHVESPDSDLIDKIVKLIEE